MSALNQAFLRAYAKHRDSDSRAESHPLERMDADQPRTTQLSPQPRSALLVDSLPPSITAPSASAVAERPRTQVDHPLYVPRHDVPLPSRPLFGARVATAPAVPQPQPAASIEPASVASNYPRVFHDNHVAPQPQKRSRVPTVELVPAWEVDEFHWPRSCEIAWDAAQDDFTSIGEQMEQVVRHGLRVLGVTSAAAREGRTTLAMCLARAAAQQGLRVLLLDADLENPQLAPALGIDVRHDWTEVISEALPLDETAVSSVADRFTLIPLLSGTSGRANLLRMPQFAQFVGQLAAVSDLVIVDLPPLDSKSLPAARPGQASPIDAVILVRDVRQTTVEQAREAHRRLDVLGMPSVGVIENFV